MKKLTDRQYQRLTEATGHLVSLIHIHRNRIRDGHSWTERDLQAHLETLEGIYDRLEAITVPWDS